MTHTENRPCSKRSTEIPAWASWVAHTHSQMGAHGGILRLGEPCPQSQHPGLEALEFQTQEPTTKSPDPMTPMPSTFPRQSSSDPNSPIRAPLGPPRLLPLAYFHPLRSLDSPSDVRRRSPSRFLLFLHISSGHVAGTPSSSSSTQIV